MILDTNGLSAMADGDSRLDLILSRADELAVPVIVLGEYLYGIEQSSNRERYRTWLMGVVANCRVLSIDERTAIEYASVRGELKRAGRLIPGNDLWIAALARQYSMSLISRDSHFDVVSGVERVSW